MRFVTPVDDDRKQPIGRRAARYMRVSTDMQVYSAENQAATIAAYADRHNLEIVASYVDQDRSGLIIDNRDGLQNLLLAVESGKADFQHVLVFDISRWGRFQDIDESAFYEFFCKRAGVRVAYCAELFVNDGSFASAMTKFHKRMMAGELSRDKSEVVSARAIYVARLGFKQGGTAGFGLQRVLVDQHRNPKCLMQMGDRKYFNSDRVVLQPGKSEEIAVVRRVFRSFVVARKSELTIARELNEEGILNEFGRPWRMLAIRRLLTCEKYIGSYVYNRNSGKLKRKRRPNPPEQWVRCDNAFEAVVDPTIFEKARRIFAKRPARLNHIWPSDEDILARLKALWLEKGKLSCAIIDYADDMPHSALYRIRFGSMRRALELIGYDRKVYNCFDARRSAIMTATKVQSDLTGKLQRSGVKADFVPPTTHRSQAIITVNCVLTVSVCVARCHEHKPGKRRWCLRRTIGNEADLILIARMDEANREVLDFHLLPNAIVHNGNVSLWKRSREKLKQYCFQDVDDLVPPIWRALSDKMATHPSRLKTTQPRSRVMF